MTKFVKPLRHQRVGIRKWFW